MRVARQHVPDELLLGQVADILTARGALAAAHAGTRLPGSSTACVVRLNRPARTIDAANLVRSAPVSPMPQHHLVVPSIMFMRHDRYCPWVTSR